MYKTIPSSAAKIQAYKIFTGGFSFTILNLPNFFYKNCATTLRNEMFLTTMHHIFIFITHYFSFEQINSILCIYYLFCTLIIMWGWPTGSQKWMIIPALYSLVIYCHIEHQIILFWILSQTEMSQVLCGHVVLNFLFWNQIRFAIGYSPQSWPLHCVHPWKHRDENETKWRQVRGSSMIP